MPKFSPLTVLRRTLRNSLTGFRRWYLNSVWGMHVGKGCSISWSAKLDQAHPRGIWIDKDTAVSFGCAILTHDFVRRMHVDTKIGARCQIGAHSIIMPGVSIGDSCVIAAGSVVMRDVPSGSMVFGNPARIMESGITTGKWGVIISRASKEVAK